VPKKGGSNKKKKGEVCGGERRRSGRSGGGERGKGRGEGHENKKGGFYEGPEEVDIREVVRATGGVGG